MPIIINIIPNICNSLRGRLVNVFSKVSSWTEMLQITNIRIGRFL